MTAGPTTGLPPTDWSSANQSHLVAELAAVKDLLRVHAAPETSGQPTRSPPPPANPPTAPESLPRPPSEATDGFFPPPALDTLCHAFGLSRFERQLLVLCAGIELDSSVAALCALAHKDDTRSHPTFSLALAALPEAHWSALAPGGPLRRWRLIELGAGPVLTLNPLRIDEPVLHYLTGLRVPDERLAGLLDPVEPLEMAELAPSHAALARQFKAAWFPPQAGRRLPVIQLCGPEAADSRALASAAVGAMGLRLATVAADALPNSAAELEALLRLLERESALGEIAPFLEWDEVEAATGGDNERHRRVTRFLERINAPVVLWSRERRQLPQRNVATFDVPRPTRAEQSAAWRKELGATAEAELALVAGVTQQFSLSLPAIRAAVADAAQGRNGSSNSSPGPKIWETCRARSRTRLDGLAWRTEPAAGWDDLVLPPPQLQTLRQIAGHVRHRATVHDTWGFAARSARGLGISALFAGPSGTGKTMAAEVLARELHLDLYHIDLASTVSKYIGETEKNLRRVFDAAEESGAILLFDEADALFGKRSEVKDSHDRYANIEVSYLLQRMEAYRGLAILTTNLKSALDTAFLRRLRFVVQFPFPDAPQRAEIWRRIFPRDTPTEGLDFPKLARLNIAGGNIRNIALNAAFVAAEAGQPIHMAHLLTAARAEYGKLERPLAEAEIGGWL